MKYYYILLFVFLMILIVPSSAEVKTIGQGDDVFIGELGINITDCVAGAPQLAWFAAGSAPATDVPNYVRSVGNAASFYIAPADFVGRTGNWYQWTGTSPAGEPAFNVLDPTMDIKVWDQKTVKDVSGKSVPDGDHLNFRIESNLFTIAQRPNYNPATDGQFTLKVKTADDFVYNALFQTTSTSISLLKVSVSQQPAYWVTPNNDNTIGWNTGVLDTQGSRMYKAGVYTCTCECNINGMKDNYKAPDGAVYSGKTISFTKTVTIGEPDGGNVTPPEPVPGAQNIPQGGDVFIGEEGLNITECVGSAPQIAWFAAGSSPWVDVPNYIKTVGDAANFYIAPADFVGRTGNWYQWLGSGPAGNVVFNVLDPSIDVRVWDQGTNKDVTVQPVPAGEFLNFRIETNMYTLAQQRGLGTGIFTITVKNATDATYTSLYQDTNTTIPLLNVSVSALPGYWVAPPPPLNVNGWNTGVLDSMGSRVYKEGSYSVTVATNINGMKDNYKAPDGSVYSGKTISFTKTVTIGEPDGGNVTPPEPVPGAQNIPQGGDVFIGEEGLNITECVGSAPQIAWFAAGSSPWVDVPNYIKTVGDVANFYIAPADFVGRTGNWYQWTGSSPTGNVAFNVLDPSIDIRIWDQNTTKDVSGESVWPGDHLNFRIDTNLYTIAQRPNYNPATDGQFMIKVKTAEGVIDTILYQTTAFSIPLTHVNVAQQPAYWVFPNNDNTIGWNTGVYDTLGARVYKAGDYTVTAECNVNGIKDNYKAPDGSDQTGKTVSAARTVTIAPLSPTPPASITGLNNTTYQQDSITWVWTDSSSDDFDHVMVYMDGIFTTNVTKGSQNYTESSLAPDTLHTIATHTVGTTGLVNLTWVNSTARTTPTPAVILPVANFTVNRSSGLPPLTVQFNDTSTGTPSLTYLWNFGDYSFSTDNDPVHTYNSPGIFWVNLTVSNSAGNSTKTIGEPIVVTDIIGGDKGYYRVHCNVEGAKVYLDDHLKGLIANGSLTIQVYVTGTPAQTYTVEKEGYQTFTAPVTDYPGKDETVDLYAELVPAIIVPVQPEIIAPDDILPVNVTSVPANVTVVNVPSLDVIIWNFFIEPIINNIPLLSTSPVKVVDPDDIIQGNVPFPFL